MSFFIIMQAQTKCFVFFCIFSALSVCPKPCVGPFPRIKISFSLLSIFVVELISARKIITLLPNPVPGNEKLPCLSNPIS